MLNRNSKNFINNNLNLNDDTIELNNKYEIWRWDINKVTNNRESYKIQQGNHKVKIAIIDSGIDRNHPDLKSNLIDSKTFVPGSTSLEDKLGHGTMVAGEICANGNVKGIAPKVAIASYKVFDNDKCGSNWVINAIVEAVNNNMDVINLSLGTYKSLLKKDDLNIILLYKKAIDYAKSKNCVVVAASGTSSKGVDISNPKNLAQNLGYKNDLRIFLPGDLSNVITVSATNKDDKLAYYSNYGMNIKIAAPAGDYGPNWINQKIANLKYMALVTYPINLPQSELNLLKGLGQGYEFIQGGTSIAAAKVSAAAALLISQYDEMYGFKPSTSEVEKLLYDGVTPGHDGNNPLYYGKGILNVKNSLDLIKKQFIK